MSRPWFSTSSSTSSRALGSRPGPRYRAAGCVRDDQVEGHRNGREAPEYLVQELRVVDVNNNTNSSVRLDRQVRPRLPLSGKLLVCRPMSRSTQAVKSAGDPVRLENADGLTANTAWRARLRSLARKCDITVRRRARLMPRRMGPPMERALRWPPVKPNRPLPTPNSTAKLGSHRRPVRRQSRLSK